MSISAIKSGIKPDLAVTPYLVKGVHMYFAYGPRSGIHVNIRSRNNIWNEGSLSRFSWWPHGGLLSILYSSEAGSMYVDVERSRAERKCTLNLEEQRESPYP